MSWRDHWREESWRNWRFEHWTRHFGLHCERHVRVILVVGNFAVQLLEEGTIHMATTLVVGQTLPLALVYQARRTRARTC